ncbi:MAG: hypothetical protein LCH26_03270 [Proteobacteria bacterium]|nr:hypothetical protein [Pseudomonadota bacterium]
MGALLACTLMCGCGDKKDAQKSAPPPQAAQPLPTSPAPVLPAPPTPEVSKPKGPPPMSPIEAYGRKLRPGSLKRPLAGTGPDNQDREPPVKEDPQDCKERIQHRYEECLRQAKDDDAKIATCEKFRVWFKGRCGGSGAEAPPQKELSNAPRQPSPAQP